MDDLKTELRDYFDRGIEPVDVGDIVGGSGYLLDAALPEQTVLRRTQGRRVGTMVASFVVVLVIGGLVGLLSRPGSGNDFQGSSVLSEPAVDTTSPLPGGDSGESTADGFRFTYTTPAPGWEDWGGFRLQKSNEGPQDAEAIVYWVHYPNSENATACGLFVGSPPGVIRENNARLDNLALMVAGDPGLDLISGPSDVQVGGYEAKHLTMTIKGDQGCDPGYFHNWRAEFAGALWMKYPIGGTVDVWLVDVPGQYGPILIIVGLTDPGHEGLRQEIQDFVSSIRFLTE